MSTVSSVCFGIVGILLLTITIFISKYTYHTKFEHGRFVVDLDRPVVMPVYFWLIISICFSIPVGNIVTFLFGALVWLIFAMEAEIALGNLPKWLESWINFLNRPVRL